MIRNIFKKAKLLANGERKESRNFYLRYRVGNMLKPVTLSLGTSSKEIAEQKSAEIIREEERVQAGLSAPKVMVQAKLEPIALHIDNFVAHLELKNRSAGYVENAKIHLDKLSRECSWDTIQKLSLESFEKWRIANKAKAPKTLNQYYDCLLYTSPSPRDGATSRMPSSA